MEQIITHHTNLDGHPIQSCASSVGVVAIDFNGMGVQDYQKWSVEDARAIVQLLTLAIADAEWRS